MATMLFPTRDEFIAKSRQGNLIPVWREVLADMETPVSAFRKIAQGRPNSFLLESVEGGERLARYSFLGTDPFLIFRSKGDTATVTEGGPRETIALKFGERDPLHVLKSLLGRYTYVPTPELPRFVGGAVGMIGYDTVRFFEKLPTLAKDDLQLDDCLFLFTDALLIFDHVKHKMLALCNARLAPGQDPGAAYDAAAAKIDELLARLKTSAHPHYWGREARGYRGAGAVGLHPQPHRRRLQGRRPQGQRIHRRRGHVPGPDRPAAVQDAPRRPVRCLPRPALHQPVAVYVLSGLRRDQAGRRVAGSAGLRAGPGQSPSAPSPARATGAARRPPRTTPSPPTCWPTRRSAPNTSCWWTWPATTSGASPSTAPSRSDELMVIEKYSHVMHIVSEVTGTLRDGLDQFDVLRASFPAGTLTGAPKVRTMEIIEELEPTRRGHYGGGIGYFSYSGDMDSAITIRTALVKGDTIYIQAAGGVVADSVPEYEYRETLAKMRALVRAVEWAEAGLE